MEKEQQIYEKQGMEEYIKYQIEHETQPFSPGPAFSFVKVRDYEEREMEKHTYTHTYIKSKTRCRVITWCQCFVSGRVYGGGE